VTTPEPADESELPKAVDPTGAPPPVSESAAISAESAPVAADDGLPEWEPLTPELVEDEAIRGDFVIRWALVGLALLFGFAPITESRTLIHVRTGEYLASHGFLPPAQDVFSYTAADRRWVNLSWLFDLLAAGVHSAAGGVGLSLIQGILAAVAFGLLVHTCRPEIRTWWGTICAALALLVCYPQFTVQPELITLVGLSVVLWLVVRSEEFSAARLPWRIVPLIWLWSQLDARAFLGPLLLVCLAIGQSLSVSIEGGVKQRNWQVALASLAVLGLHPFTWESWLAPYQVFAIDYPALQQLYPRPGRIEQAYFPITLPVYWSSINHQAIAALVLVAATVTAMILNRERLRAGHLIAVLVFVAVGCLATHELAAASLVCCALGTVNAQTWYRHRFGQVYSTDWRELVFSRGGRAITVLSFFAIAWVIISGRIEGPAGRRTGLGFSPLLWTQMESYSEIASRQLDDRAFHFAPRQGDLLIWSGQKSFVDMRAGLFAGSGESDLIALHDRTRRAMQLKREALAGSGEPDVWRATFAKYELTHTLPRLSAPNPDYISFGDLLANREWVLTDLVPSTAVFYFDGPGDKLQTYLKQNRFDFVGRAFRIESIDLESTRFLAKPPTWSERLLSLQSPVLPARVQLATHYIQISSAPGNIPLTIRAACALLAVRHATAGLHENSNSSAGYHALAIAYQLLDQFESEVMNEAQRPWFSAVRYYQIVGALRQAAALDPDNWQVQTELLSLFQRTQRGEFALDSLKNLRRIRKSLGLSAAEDAEQRQEMINRELALTESLGKVQDQAEQQLQNGADRFQVAAAAYQVGAVGLAIKTLEDDRIYMEQNPLARSALGNWLIEAGRLQDGTELLEEIAAQQQVPGWRDAMATASLLTGDYLRATDLWRQQIDESRTSNVPTVLLTMPFVTLNPLWMGADNYPLTHLAAALEVMGTVRSTATALNFQIGQVKLEQGDVAGASQAFQRILDASPRTQIRPLVRFYLEALTGTPLPAEPPVEPQLEELEAMGDDARDPAARPATPNQKK